MSLRRTIVEIDPSTLNVTKFCEDHGISTWFFWNLRRRVQRDGLSALEPKSRAPHRIPNKTPIHVEDAIVAKRKELVDAGLDAGPGTIAFHLRKLHGMPSEATVWRILTARGFIVPDPSKAPKRPGRRFCADRANDWWGLDDTNWKLADGTVVKILNVIDDHSRLLVASTAMAACTGAATLSVLATAAMVLGWPAAFLSDNAPVFRSQLAGALAPLGIDSKHTRPYHPQTNGKVERFHQTVKKWLAKQPRAETIDQLQTQLDTFRHLYNHQRPHRGIDRQFPADVWATAPKSGPSTHPITTPTHVYQSNVNGCRVQLGRHYVVNIGQAHDGEHALAVLTGLTCHIFIDGRLIEKRTIDPTRRYQPRINKQTPNHLP